MTGGESRRVVFLDRDGTLTVDRGYTWRLQDYALQPGVPAALRRLEEAGYALAIVTNQSGIGRGYYAESDYAAFQRHLIADLGRQGVRILESFHCPHRPDAGCACRKPGTALLERARDEIGADLARSWMIGDNAGDMALATRAGLEGAVLVLTGHGPEASRSLPKSTLRAQDLQGAADLVLSRGSLAGP
jgi:D-glycero-D-manno-heptose 1,7-bisphosphate phosphatase